MSDEPKVIFRVTQEFIWSRPPENAEEAMFRQQTEARLSVAGQVMKHIFEEKDGQLDINRSKLDVIARIAADVLTTDPVSPDAGVEYLHDVVKRSTRALGDIWKIADPIGLALSPQLDRDTTLLKKYMAHVFTEEGTTFAYGDRPMYSEFTDEEWTLLTSISDTLE